MDCFDREFLEILGNDIADEKEKPVLLNEGMIQISTKSINQKENDSELDAYIKEAFGDDDEYDELPEEEDFDFDKLSDEENELASDEYEPELEDEEELLTEKTNELKNTVSKEKVNELYERENNNNFVAESFNANPSLPESDKKLLVFWGFEPKDFPQIELAMQKTTFEDENANLLSAKEAEKYLGHKEFLSGLARCAFHGSAVRYPNNDSTQPSIYFEFDLANA